MKDKLIRNWATLANSNHIVNNETCREENSGFIFPPKLAPVKIAIFPLVKKDKELTQIAKDVYKDLRQEWNISYDESGSIGKRYARNDEIGTPFCITIDSDSVEKNDVTIRNRDDGAQKRIKINELKNILKRLISEKISFRELWDRIYLQSKKIYKP